MVGASHAHESELACSLLQKATLAHILPAPSFSLDVEQSLILNLLDDYLTICILALVVSATSLGAQHSEAMASMWRYAVSR